MKKLILVILLVVVALLLSVSLFFVFSNSKSNSNQLGSNKNYLNQNNEEIVDCDLKIKRETLVSLDLAKAVGAVRLSKFYPGFNWVFVGNIITYDMYGDQAGYVLIFRKDTYGLNTLEKLESNTQTAQSDNEKYQFDNVATIMTGAMKEDKLILRHFRGVPEFFGKREEIRAYVESNYPGKTIGRVISLTPMSFGYEIINRNSGKATGDMISNNKIISLPNEIARVEKNKNRRMSWKECEAYQNAVLEAIKANIAEWNSF